MSRAQDIFKQCEGTLQDYWAGSAGMSVKAKAARHSFVMYTNGKGESDQSKCKYCGEGPGHPKHDSVTNASTGKVSKFKD